MPKKIHKFHDCKKDGCVGRMVGQVISGVRKRESLIQTPGQPNVEVVYGMLLQCIYCKQVIMQEIVPANANQDPANKIVDPKGEPVSNAEKV